MTGRVLSALLLLVALAPLALLLRPRSGGGRQSYQRLAAGHWLRFGLPSVVLLTVTGQASALLHLPAAFAPAQMLLGVDGFGPADRTRLLGSAAIGIAIGVGAGLLLTAWRAWRGRPEGALLGDARSVLPRGSHELGWAAVVAVTAGLTEEAYFRLLLPLLATAATGSAAAAFTGAALLFGAAHRYQGWRGVLATTFAGAALTLGYLATESLATMMAVHAAGDLGNLVLRPALRLAIQRGQARRQSRLEPPVESA